MDLKNVLVGIEGLKAKGSLDLDISGIECDCNAVKEGNLFVAIKGFEFNVAEKLLPDFPQSIIFES